jgi:hypothetical protein
MTQKQFNILLAFLVLNTLLFGVHWAAFNFINPLAGWLTGILHVLILINLPYNKFNN